MKVLLINPVYPERPRAIFPLGLAYVAEALSTEGYDIDVLDTDVSSFQEKDIRRKIAEGDFDIVGTGGLITAYNHIKWLVSLVKEIKPDVPVIVGGGGASSIPRLMLEKTLADVVVIGEGEKTLINVLKSLKDGASLSEVKGIFYKEGNSIHQNPPADAIENIDALPFPKWNYFQLEKYIEANIGPAGTRMMPVFASRSCPYSCTFCFHPIGKKYRVRSNRNILEEIKFLVSNYKIHYINFVDELFLLNKKQIMSFCDLLITEDINIKWGCASRTNIADVEMYHMMKKAGCTNFQFGIESGNDEMLKSMNKNDTTEGSKKAIKIAREAGFEPHCTFMIGTIGENERTIDETINFIKEMNIRIDSFFFTTPYPGAEIYNWALDRKIIKNEEEFIKILGNAVKFTVNLTKLSDWKLIQLKCKAEKEVKSFYDSNNIPQIITHKNNTKGRADLEIRCILTKCGKDFSVNVSSTQLIKCPFCGKKYFLNRRLIIKHLGISWYLHSLKNNFVDIKSAGIKGFLIRLYVMIFEKFADKAGIVFLSTHPLVKRIISYMRKPNYWA